MDRPIFRTNKFNTNLPETGTTLLTTAIKTTNHPGVLRIYICLSIAGVVSVRRTYGGVTVSEQLNGGVALTANVAYTFFIPWVEDEQVNLICSTPTFAGSSCADKTGTCNGSPVTLGVGSNTITVTAAGTFTVTLPVGVSGQAISGTATLASSPVTLPENTATDVDSGATTGTFFIVLTGGVITKLQIDEMWRE